MKKTRFICLLLVLMIGVVPFVVTGCAGKGDGGEVNDVEAGELPPIFAGEQRNFKGAPFTVMTDNDRTASQAFNIVDLVSEDNLGDDAIKTAVERRNTRIRNTFGVTIERLTCPSDSSSYNEASKNILKGDYETADVYMTKVTGALNLASKGTLADLNFDVESMDLTEPWWDSAIIESLLLLDGAYFCLGDINLVDNDATWCVLYNKALWETFFPDRPKSFLYDKVREGINNDGGWTTELLKYYAKEGYKDDMNASVPKWDMSYTGSGTYGLYLQDQVSYVLVQASGNTPTKLERNSVGFKSCVNTDEFQNAVQAAFDFMGGSNNDKWLVNFSKGSYGTGDIWDITVRGGFKANKALFFICHCGSINLMRDMDDPFGILPIPKLSDDQQNYGNSIQYENATCYIIPYVDDDVNDDNAYILEAMAYYSSNEFDEYIGQNISLTYAYYDTVLKRKASRDDDSWDMLDLIFDSRIFDIACALNLSGINNIIINAATATTAPNLGSALASSVDMMDAISQQLKDMNK